MSEFKSYRNRFGVLARPVTEADIALYHESPARFQADYHLEGYHAAPVIGDYMVFRSLNEGKLIHVEKEVFERKYIEDFEIKEGPYGCKVCGERFERTDEYFVHYDEKHNKGE